MDYNDYPCLNLALPVFSERAMNIVRPLFAEGGEWLPLKSSPSGYWLFNVLTVIDCLDQCRTRCERFEDEPERIMSVEQYEFNPDIISGVNIFRIPNDLMSVFVSERVVEAVSDARLSGFVFYKTWPLQPGQNYRDHRCDISSNREIRDRHSIIIILTETNRNDTSVIDLVLEKIDGLLKVRRKGGRYRGRLEGSEKSRGDRRVFISTPDVDELSADLLKILKTYATGCTSAVYNRYGHYTDPLVREVREVRVV